METAWYTPEPTDATEEYWDATAEERLVVPYCTDCEDYFFYPRHRCPECMSEAVEHRESSGEATLESYTTVYRPPVEQLQAEAPYINALVRLEEGVQLMTNIVADSEDDLSVGMDLSLTWRPTDGDYNLPYWEANE